MLRMVLIDGKSDTQVVANEINIIQSVFWQL